jgi:membrane protease subunit (stomatin/prohibitin family)
VGVAGGMQEHSGAQSAVAIPTHEASQDAVQQESSKAQTQDEQTEASHPAPSCAAQQSPPGVAVSVGVVGALGVGVWVTGCSHEQ